MELHDALTQIAEIRQRMARGQIFRGYSAAGTAFTGLVAIAAGMIQSVFVADPLASTNAYLLVWLAAAAVSVLGVGGALALRFVRCDSPLHRQMTLIAADQFLPSIVAGGLLTWVLSRRAPDSLWMLPGLWAILFGLGVFASRRFMPRGIVLPAGFYLLAGACCLTLPPEAALSPWTMASIFGAGQLMTAAVLYFTLERKEQTDV